MYDRVLVPFDRSDYSWRAVAFARKLADHWGADLEIIHVAGEGESAEPIQRETIRQVEEHGWSYNVTATVLEAGPGGTGETIAAHAAARPNTFVVMTTHGRGRSAAFLGSVADGLLHELDSPILLVGPKANPDRMTLDGPVVACVDGSEASESSLPLLANLALDFKVEPWVVVVGAARDDPTYATLASNYTARLARHLQAAAAVTVQYEVLHDDKPPIAAAEFASSIDATMLTAVTRTKGRLKRLVEGSFTMELVHEADVPVLVFLAD